MMNNNNKSLLRGVNYDDPVAQYRGARVARISRILLGKEIEIPVKLSTDIFYSFYLPMPILREADEIPESRINDYKLISSLLSSTRIHEIRSKTLIDPLLSSIAASVFISEMMKLAEKEKGEKPGRKDGKGKTGVIPSNLKEDQLKSMVEKAANITARDVDNAKKLKTLVEGQQPGTISMMAYEEYGPELIKLARNLEVRRILDLLTGIKPWKLRIPERKLQFKHGELESYEYGKDIERIVPSRLALPDELFYLRLLEGKLLLYRKVLTQGKGPIYVLLDKSGSMDGTKMIWAKAVTLSLYMRAVRENREFYFRFFDSIPYPLTMIRRRPKAKQVLKMIEYIARIKGSGGTDISKAIITACNDIRRARKKDLSDIILITDGVDRIAENLVRYNLKRARARLVTVMVMGDNRSLKNISVKYFAVMRLSQKNLLQIVEV
ncbi:MAG: VWA domain-containing protein [Crenarchaeota archaeon]|nr:VWA domain-containing protein [Thermoproteota archaeon]